MTQQLHNYGPKNHTFVSKAGRTSHAPPPTSNQVSAPAMHRIEQPVKSDVSLLSPNVPEQPADLPDALQKTVRAKAAVGQKLRLGLDFVTVVGGPEIDKAKLTASIFHEGKKLRKIDQAVPTDQVLQAFLGLLRSTSDEGDLLALVSRFVEPLPE